MLWCQGNEKDRQLSVMRWHLDRIQNHNTRDDFKWVQCSWIFTEKALDAMSICGHAHAHMHTYIPFKLLKSNHWWQARDGLKKTPKIIGSNGKDIYKHFSCHTKRRPYVTVPSRVYFMERKPVWRVEKFLPLQFGIPTCNYYLSYCTFSCAWQSLSFSS